ncbi:MAG: MarR family transcriptional regulator [Acidimicrobiia bacterium]
MNPTAAQNEYVERVGRWWESVSGSRSAGRILGWLMICEPPHRSAAQLVEELHLSAGSVSTQTTVLERIGFVERVTFPGDRVTYYQLPEGVWVELMRTELQRIEEMRGLAAAATDVLPQERSDRVEDLDRVALFFHEEWPGLMERLVRKVEKERR